MENTVEAAKNITFQTNVDKCIGCGTCLHSCPVYRERFDEKYGPRGRNHLLRSFGYKVDAAAESELKTIFEKCLLCGRCVAGCPRGVRNDLVVLAARGELIRQEGLPAAKSMVFRKIMADRKSMGRWLRLASRLQCLLPRSKREGSLKQGVVLRHLPLYFFGLAKGRQLPSIANAFLSETLSESNAPLAGSADRKLRVAYFSGCATEYVLPSAGRSLVRLLNASGVEVIFPKDQGCCGIAVEANGDVETARQMALRNLRALFAAKADLIVTGCATCGSTLKEGWANLFRDDPRQGDFLELAAKVRDISELLVELAEYKPMRYRSKLPPGVRVTYHDPCHLAGYQGITEEPRQILREVFGSDFVEMDYKGCCGCGGSFSLHSADLSKRIGEEKIESIARTGAEVVVNDCPGCMIQLLDGLSRRDMPQRVLHLTEVIEDASIR
ncbi:MAG: (Fe-S)-binding protein [Desulfobacteraceae bacterium]|nr:(Fe-S)-binding protein [Desulfobacteraceae bacterium]